MRAVVVGGGAQNNNPKIKNTNVTTIGSRQISTPTARPALHIRDKNVIMRTTYGSTPLTAKSGNAKMPPSHDKHQNVARPLVPILGPAALKVAGKIPLTPKVAHSNVSTASTPLSRRTPGTASPLPSPRDDFTTPVPTFLNHNITPRSGTRKSRVDSTNSTPNGTPNGTPGTFSVDKFRSPNDPLRSPGLSVPGADRDTTKRPTVTFSPDGADVHYQRASTHLSSSESKFFLASEAKTATQVPKQRPTSQGKSPTFFYARGESIPGQNNPNISTTGSIVNEERSQPKFFHANGTPDLQASPTLHFPSSRPSSTVSTASRMPVPRLGNTKPNLSQPQRPPSPHKLGPGLHTSTPPLRSPALAAPVAQRPHSVEFSQSMHNFLASKRLSAEKERIVSHGRSPSLISNMSMSPPARSPTQSIYGETSMPMTPGSLNIVLGEVTTPEEDESRLDGIASGLQSPIKAGHSLERMNELAATARQERKVLDLEITNSSLAAINRTLEREMRKQTAELRRYRRLSRSGRLSIATTTSKRTSSIGSLSMMDGLDGTNLSDMSGEEQEGEEEDEEDEEDEEEDYDSSEDSPDDNSQRMNQSLKRCLSWTEELIKEGKKALSYSVRVSDIELGGRVLAPDEVEDFQYDLELVRGKPIHPWTGPESVDGDMTIEIDTPQKDKENRLYETPTP
ncbi:hypothetical protein B7463_g5454, partial [Scytalidium lignicola]